VTPPLPAILAHRGGAREAPENTLAAIAHARSSGADGIELDLRLSGDGEAVVFHDADLRRLGGSRRRVDASGLHELVVLDLGRRRQRFTGAPIPARIPTLGAALEAARGLATIQLELKPDGDVRALARHAVAAAYRHDLGSALEVTSSSRAAVDAVRALAPAARVGLVLDEPPEGAWWLDYPIVSLSLALARAGWAERAHRAGVDAYVWTENDPAALALWAAAGVRGVITDRPARFAMVRQALRRAAGSMP
jgi:glycerophosphoryl diester phosphodiesterase